MSKESANVLRDTAKYDEYQKNIRNQYGKISFFVLTILIFASGLIEIAEPYVQNIIIVLLVMFYYTTNLIIKGAYVAFNKEKVENRFKFINLILGAMFIYMGVMQFNRYGMESIYKDGLLQHSVIYYFNAIFFIYTTLLNSYVYRKNNK